MKVAKVFRLFLPVLSGLLLSAGWSPSVLSPLLFIALVPILIYTYLAKNIFHAFIGVFVTLFIWILYVVWWLVKLNLVMEDALVVYLFFVLAPLIYSLPWLILKWMQKEYAYKSFVFFPFLWLAFEYFMSIGDFSFTWIQFGWGISNLTRFLNFFQYIGIEGMSFFIVLINVSVSAIILFYQEQNIRKIYIYVCIGCILFLLIPPLLLSKKNIGEQNIIKVALLQPALNPYEIDRKLPDLVQRLKDTEPRLKQEHVNLLVCPEAYLKGTPSIFINNLSEDPFVLQLREISKNIQAPILTGFIGYKMIGGIPDRDIDNIYNPMPDQISSFQQYNAALFITPDGKTQIYTKNKLVPFMEKVPLSGLFPFMDNLHLKLNKRNTSYSRIPKPVVFIYNDLKIAPMICLDQLFPEFDNQFIVKGANLIAIISDESWSGKSKAYEQLEAYSQALAATLNKSVVRSSNKGTTMICNAQGKITKKLAWGETNFLIGEVATNRIQSFYSKYVYKSYRIISDFVLLSLFFFVFKKLRNRIVSPTVPGGNGNNN